MAGPAQTAEKPFTLEDYRKLSDDGNRYEVIEGELLVSPSPSARHQSVVARLVRILGTHVVEQELGEVFCAPLDVIFSDDNVVQPDVLFFSNDRLGVIDTWAKGAPDLAVEILSTSTSRRDTEVKFDLYARFGVSHYWILNPDEHVLIAFRLADGKYERVALCQGEDRFQPELFEGLTIELGQVWSDL